MKKLLLITAMALSAINVFASTKVDVKEIVGGYVEQLGYETLSAQAKCASAGAVYGIADVYGNDNIGLTKQKFEEVGGYVTSCQMGKAK